ncbi:PspC domain-containing protein [Nocardioides sp. WS12]|uniref:PspC domain-containing protein n=1 Tax=Nocardioides sp. WS12 TaxID=2486272 RepID=UPI0015FE1434|nr:PspC domain-containing protein [Nocardioides sp. WS12]
MSNYDNYPAPSPAPSYPQATAGRRLTRRSHNRMVAGVCGGIADHFGVDATIVRLVLVAAIVFGSGLGIVLYAVAWWLMPEA